MSDKEIKFDDLLGKPFEEEGKGPDSYNCLSLCVEVCKRAGIELPCGDWIYDETKRAVALEQGKLDFFERIEEPEPYCLVVFSDHPPWITHIGVVLADSKRFIHILRKRSVAIEKLNKEFWKKKREGFYRYIGPAKDKTRSD